MYFSGGFMLPNFCIFRQVKTSSNQHRMR